METQWQLTDEEAAKLKTILGPKGLSSTQITVKKTYNEEITTWVVPANERETVAHLLSESDLHAEEREPLEGKTTVAAVKTALEALAGSSSERHTALLAKS